MFYEYRVTLWWLISSQISQSVTRYSIQQYTHGQPHH